MILTLNINQMAEPVVKETERTSFIVRFLFFLESKLAKKMHNALDSTILMIEGSYTHLEELNSEKAQVLLSDTKQLISKFDKLEVKLEETNYFSDDDLKEKFKYLYRSLYKFESILHKISYKDAPVLATSEDVKLGLSKINKRNFSKFAS